MSNKEKLVARYHVAMTKQENKIDRTNANTNTQVEPIKRESLVTPVQPVHVKQEKQTIKACNSVITEKKVSTKKKSSNHQVEKTSSITDKTVSALIATSDLFQGNASSSGEDKARDTASMASEQGSYMSSFCNVL